MGISVRQTADRMGVNTARVRALIRDGVLVAEKIGGRWLVDETAVKEQQRVSRPGGRPFSRARAWGLLMLASGRPAPWLSRFDRSKLRRRLREADLQQLAPRLKRRADVHLFRAHASDIARIAEDRRTILTGVSAAGEHGEDLLAPGVLDAYVRATSLRQLARHFNLQPNARGNVTVRAIDAPWPFAADDAVASVPVVGVDLLDSNDGRTRRAGQRLLAKVTSDD